MYIKFGNLTVDEFAEAISADFTRQEREFLESKRTDTAEFTNPDAFHIFKDPSISVHLGQDAYSGRVAEIFKAANERSIFTQEVAFSIETRAASAEWITEVTG